MPGERRRITFPLIPRWQLQRLPFGETPSRRRGHGSEVIGHRAYAPGDLLSTIDWGASARASAASGQDDFIVREHALDEAPRVLLVLDRRPAMALYPPPFPWLCKREAMLEAAATILASGVAARAELGMLDFGEGGESPCWLAPSRGRSLAPLQARLDEAPFCAPQDTLARALAWLSARRSEASPGSFMFVLSDFLGESPGWQAALGSGWDLVPVVIQDPRFERSFPALGGVAVPLAAPEGARVGSVRLSRREAARRREANERRFAALLEELRALGLEPVLLETSEEEAIGHAFLAWAELRMRRRWAA